jgi:hypothetical protein
MKNIATGSGCSEVRGVRINIVSVVDARKNEKVIHWIGHTWEVP